MQRYQVLFTLAKGGMGRVDLAVLKEGSFKRLFAVKRLHSQLLSSSEFRAMFMDEARLAGLVHHPNVVSVLDVGEDEEGPFLVMDYVQGVTAARLSAALKGASMMLPIQLCCRIGVDVARGLHAAHNLTSYEGNALRLVHRDVSPQNILIGEDGVARVTDFGIARAVERQTRTSSGVLKGKVGYMAPEILRFEEPDRRSDLFSLGVVLFELVAGHRLYTTPKATSDTAREILSGPVPDITLERIDVPLQLQSLLMQLLAKERDQRPANADVVAKRLEMIIEGLVGEEGAMDLRELVQRFFADELKGRRVRVKEALDAVGRKRRSPAGEATSGEAGVIAGSVQHDRSRRRRMLVLFAVVSLAVMILAALSIDWSRTTIEVEGAPTYDHPMGRLTSDIDAGVPRLEADAEEARAVEIVDSEEDGMGVHDATTVRPEKHRIRSGRNRRRRKSSSEEPIWGRDGNKAVRLQ